MATDQPSAGSQKRQVQKSDSFASYYTNDTQVQTGVWDVRLIFGLINEVDKEAGVVYVTQVAEVRMSPQHALRVHRLLGEQLERYAVNFGTIPEPVTDGDVAG